MDDGFFAAKLYPILEKAECRMCHNDNGVSSATRLHFPAPEAKADAIEIFGLKLSVLVDRKNVSRSLLLNKPTQRIPHTGGERILKGSPEEAVLRTWVEHLASLSDLELKASVDRLSARSQGPAKPGDLRRLTHSQYNNTVRDLLGDFTRPADHFPPEDFVNGFTNQVEGQSMPPLLVEAYTIAAEKLAAERVPRRRYAGAYPLQAGLAGRRACRDQFIRSFGRKAFRRPLTDDEVADYADLFAGAAASQHDFLAGAQACGGSDAAVARVSLPPRRWTRTAAVRADYGIASRLSYFLWDTMPDEACCAPPQRENLRTPAADRARRPAACWTIRAPSAPWKYFSPNGCASTAS